MISQDTERKPLARSVGREWILLALILLLAACLRFYRLDSVPPGLTHDEADFSHDAIAVYHGARPLYVATYGYQDEPLMHYASAIVMTVVGPSYLGVRIASALFGVVVVLLAFLWARMALGTQVALGVAIWLAVSYWPVATSRFAVQVGPIASLAALACIFFWLGLGCPRLDGDAHQHHGARPVNKWRAGIHWGLFTLCVVASIYAYEAARVTWVLFPIFVFYLIFVRADLFKKHWWQVALALGIAALLSLPLLAQPAAFSRAGSLAGPLEAMLKGSFGPILINVRDVLAAFTFKGDPFVTYNLPGRPIFGPVSGALFYGGVLICLYNWRKPAFTFVLLWLVTGIAPSMLTSLHSSSLRGLAAQPAVYILPALVFAQVVKWLEQHAKSLSAFFLPAGLALIAIGGGLVTYRDYFVRWTYSPETQGAYFSDVFQMIRYLDSAYTDLPVVLSSPFPNLPHDPYIAQVMNTKHPLDIRWFDGQRALVFPSASTARLAVLSRSPIDSLLSDELKAHQGEHVLVGATGNSFDVFDWQPASSWDAIRQAYGDMQVGADKRLTLPVNFAHSVELVGYSFRPSTITVGSTLNVITLWRVLNRELLGPVPPGYYGYDAAIFVHILNGEGKVAAQEDRLDAPAWDWRPGDTFVQIHRLAIGPDLAPGRYSVEIGLYTRPDQRRLLVYHDGEPLDDHFLLQPVEIMVP